MSRELKFRVWDKKRSRYVGDGEIVFKSYGNEAAVVVCPNSQDYIGDICHDEYTDDGRFVVEQSTGLKDKNGKEIYVGDIVSEHNGDIVGEIIQKPSGEYCIAWIGIYGGSSVLYDELSMCEVIGNIHENKELLGGGK